MRPTFLFADSHFCDLDMSERILDGNTEPLRPFGSVDEHDEEIIANWNCTVPKDGKVYVLGDVAMKKEGLQKFDRLNGSRKILILGNHDIYPTSLYLKYFKDVRATNRFDDGILLSHIPIHPSTFGKAHKLNVHGHIHKRQVMIDAPFPDLSSRVVDHRYFCVSAEQINYTPIDLEVIRGKCKHILCGANE